MLVARKREALFKCLEENLRYLNPHRLVLCHIENSNATAWASVPVFIPGC